MVPRNRHFQVSFEVRNDCLVSGTINRFKQFIATRTATSTNLLLALPDDLGILAMRIPGII